MLKRTYKQTEEHLRKRVASYKKFLQENPKFLIGKGNPNYKGDRALTKQICYCKELTCNNKICFETFRYGKGRCEKCSQTRENNSCWIDGRSSNPYPRKFNTSLKKSIRERDNEICQQCEMTQEEHLSKYKKSLNVHHIDYDKDNCEEWNLITLCIHCNIKANKKRTEIREEYKYLNYINLFSSNYVLN